LKYRLPCQTCAALHNLSRTAVAAGGAGSPAVVDRQSSRGAVPKRKSGKFGFIQAAALKVEAFWPERREDGLGAENCSLEQFCNLSKN